MSSQSSPVSNYSSSHPFSDHGHSPKLIYPSDPHDFEGRVVSTGASHTPIVHPYARLYSKNYDHGKRRKIWNHALEKSLFNAYELSTLGAPHRRTIYMASLEAHVDRLHTQLLSLGFWPVALEDLDPFKGLNSKTAKSMISGLQHDTFQANLKLLELKRANDTLMQQTEDLRVASYYHNK